MFKFLGGTEREPKQATFEDPTRLEWRVGDFQKHIEEAREAFAGGADFQSQEVTSAIERAGACLVVGLPRILREMKVTPAQCRIFTERLREAMKDERNFEFAKRAAIRYYLERNNLL